MIDELSPDARAVIAAGLRAERPTAADRARVRAALDARLAAESSRPRRSTSSSSSSESSWFWKAKTEEANTP